jgi:hypothetical protein
MTKKSVFLLSLVLCFFCAEMDSNSFASDIEKAKAIPIPAERIAPSFYPFTTSGERACVIQYDSGSAAYYFPDFDTGWGFAVYMDPQFCGEQNSYPFKITGVQFYLRHFSNGRTAVWPVEIRVNIRDLKKDTVCLGPGTLLYHQTFTIPIDSSYDSLGRPMNLSLDSLTNPSSTCCLNDSFFLEIIFTGGTSAPFPSLLMTATTDSADTCHDWLLSGGTYHEWYTTWELPTPGNAIIRTKGYTHSLDCYSCWHWIPTKTSVPSGMPDFDQYQFGDSLTNDSSALDIPTAAANCLKWCGAVPEDTRPPELIRLLSTYLGTDPDSGTSVDSLQIGLGRYLTHYGFDFYEHTYRKPDFKEMADSLKKSQNVVLILGFWQFDGVSWHRFGGHATTLAGVCSESSWVAFSDPAVDGAELGGQGRFFPLGHVPHPDNDTLHNDSIYVSHDIYISDTLFLDYGDSLDTLWGIQDFYDNDTSLFRKFEGRNFQPGQKLCQAPYVPEQLVYTAVEYAVMICPKPQATLWYWKPDRPDQDPSAESGMPDFDQHQFSPSDSQALCGPASVANCLWWFGQVPQDTSPPDLIRLLSDYFHSDSDLGTYVDSIQAGLDSLFEQYGSNLYDTTFYQPDFQDMADSLKKSQDVILLFGFWQYDTTEQMWYRFGGHFVTMAGVCSDSSKIAFSDPGRDNAESGGKGRVRPSWHPSHPEDATYHNNTINISHDVYGSDTLFVSHPDTVDTLWGIADYYSEKDTSWFYQFEGKNFQPGQMQYFHSYEPSESVYTAVEYAIMICPKSTSVEEEEEIITPKDFELFQNHPNPFNLSTTIPFTVHGSQFMVHRPIPVTLKIYNILGQKVRTLVDEPKRPGSYEVIWDGEDEKGKDLSSGIYFYQLKLGEITQTKRMILLK